VSEPIIRVENLGKKYLIRHEAGGQRYKSLRETLATGAKGLVRRLGYRSRPEDFGSREEFWALRDVSFDVNRGEVVGIIGRNGAGKSTLLKILSQITEPTTGRVELHGRVASLLEVGTGFHPELTGRENIYLNGAILGMSRKEISQKFDEIVAFAEIEKFLDTSVKRYSSGMYMRLAFSVAAHLEPEVLLIDEVLAVGDAEFQKKCLGKMSAVAKEGRTILFVSHNMAAVSTLTTRAIVLHSGRSVFDGPKDQAIEHYARRGNAVDSTPAIVRRGVHTVILGARLIDATGQPVHNYMAGEPMRLEVMFETDGASSLSLEAFLLDATRHKLALASLHQFHGATLPTHPGRYRTLLELEPMWLASGAYSFDITTSLVNVNWDHYVEDALTFDVCYSNPRGRSWDFKHSFGFGAFALAARIEPEFHAI
jgi:lipopolysaccharide transport system ATP-binding protein